MEEIDKLRVGDDQNYATSRAKIGDSVSLIEDLVGLYDLLGDLVKHSGVSPRDEVAAPAMFLLACRYNLTMASLMALRGHLNDSFYFTRKAIESCAFAHRVKCDPTLALKWLQSWHDPSAYKKFRKEFATSKLFPQTHVLLSSLYSRYDFSSRMVHPSIFSFGGHLRADRRPHLFEMTFDYFQLTEQDSSEPVRTLLWISDTHFGILRLFEEVLSVIIDCNPQKWAVHRNAVDAKITVHKLKWRSVLLQSEASQP